MDHMDSGADAKAKLRLVNREQRVLVTGGAGFIGSHIVDVLIDRGYRVFVIDNLSTGQEENLNPAAQLYKVDVNDHKKTARTFEKIHPAIVFHLAAQINVRASVEDPVSDAETNILASVNLIQLAHQFGVQKFIFSSTGGAIYGNARVLPTPETATAHPLSPYAIGKLTVERYLRFSYRAYKLNSTILRYSNVYGPRQNAEGEAGVIAVFLDRMLRGEQPIINGDGGQTRDYVYVGDVVSANMAALDNPRVTGVFNIGTGVQTDVNEIFHRLNRHFNEKFQEQHGPEKPGETRHSALLSVLAKRRLGWQASVPLTEGIQATILWYKAKAKANGE